LYIVEHEVESAAVADREVRRLGDGTEKRPHQRSELEEEIASGVAFLLPIRETSDLEVKINMQSLRSKVRKVVNSTVPATDY